MEITTLRYAEGYLVFGIDVPALSSEPRAVTIEEAVSAALGDYDFRAAATELRRAIRDSMDTGFHCYRAVEAVRRHWQPDGVDKSAAWTAMRDAINLSRESLGTLREFGDRQRHAEWPFMSDEERARDMVLTARVIDRFAVMLTRNATRLDVDEFPPI